jgi:hydrogenase maturation protease
MDAGNQSPIRCLILACGNTLRGDDGIGPWLAEWAAARLRDEPAVRILSRQQWTPELAEEIAAANSVIFIDGSAEVPPGAVKLAPVAPAASDSRVSAHYLGAAELLALSRELYGSLPGNAWLLTVGIGSIELGEEFSTAVQAALPVARDLLNHSVKRLLSGTKTQGPVNVSSGPA